MTFLNIATKLRNVKHLGKWTW